jgi:tripartite-type tricarboxylate transporter receptor subunit TctC
MSANNSLRANINRRTFVAATGAIASLGYLPGGFAQGNKQIRVVIPYPPAGPTDIVGRIVIQALSEELGQTFVIENKAGASGMIGADVVAKAPPDGTTLLINVSGHVINPSLYAKMSHDPLKDFRGITRLASTPIQLVVGANSPFKSVDDVVKAVRAEPGKHTFASSSNGTPGHLMGELFKDLAKLDALHVPYKGAAPALTDVIGGQVSYMFDSMPSSINLVKSGRLRSLGVSSPHRVPALPNVPTFAEQGFPALNLSTWYGFWAPAKTPDATIQRLYDATSKVLALPATRTRIQDALAEPNGEDPKKFDEFCRAEAQRYAAIVKSAGIKPE